LTYKKISEGHLTLRFLVEDTGNGIGPNEIDHVFEPFFQGPSSALQTSAGTGLGLSISKNIVELMGGSIWVESTLGKGCRFFFEIPAEYVVGADQLLDKLEIENPALKKSALQLRVLLVDDYVSNRIYAIQVLEHLGHSVAVALDGKQALDMVKNNTYDVILMDLQMPVMDGCESTLNIRSFEKANGKPRTIILAMTAESSESEIVRARSSGIDGIILKPFTPATLADHLAIDKPIS
jgi:CheY-like chemotaxis protein